MSDNTLNLVSIAIEGVFGVLLIVAIIYIIQLRLRIRELSSNEMQTTMGELSKTVDQLRHGLGQQLAEARELSETLSGLIAEAKGWEGELSDGINQLSRTVSRAHKVQERLEQYETVAASAMEPLAEPRGLSDTESLEHTEAEPAASAQPEQVGARAEEPAADDPTDESRAVVRTQKAVNGRQVSVNNAAGPHGGSKRGIRRLLGTSAHGHGNA